MTVGCAPVIFFGIIFGPLYRPRSGIVRRTNGGI